jgi:hypothetical protein
MRTLKALKTLALTAFLTSVIVGLKWVTGPEVDPAFTLLSDSFRAKAAEFGFKTPTIAIHFGEPPYGLRSNLEIVGFCYRWPFTRPEIRVRKMAWEFLNEKQRLALLYHELGHCALNREHTDTELTALFETPTSLMSPYLVSESDLNKRYDYYISELFTHISSETLMILTNPRNIMQL